MILLTGASAVSAMHLHAHMLAAGRRVIATDVRPARDPHDVVEIDLVNANTVDSVDEIVHFSAISNEKSWSFIQSENIERTRNIVESARRHGVRRVVFASSCHVMGFLPTANVSIRLNGPVRPDTMYAVFLPKSSRNARNFYSRDDLVRSVNCGLDMRDLGFRTVYALSDNPNPFCVNEPDPGLRRIQASCRVYAAIAREGETNLRIWSIA
jgi:nucleoside-diphosphate-sugar epimerase